MRSFRSGIRVKLKIVSPSPTGSFSGRRKITSPYSSHHSGPCSVVNPSSARRSMRRSTASLPTGDSIGFSAFSSCIFIDETDEVFELERFTHEIVRSAHARLLGDVAVAGHDDVRDVFRFG